MRGIYILLAPMLWSIKNDITRFNRTFYKKVFFYILLSGAVILSVMKLLTLGMAKLQNLSPDVFNVLLVKGYSIIFIIVFFVQIINGFVISLNAFYQSQDMEVLLISPVNRTALFFAKLFETYVKTSWMLVVFGLPLLAAPGILAHAKPWYYFYAVTLFSVFSLISVNIGASLSIGVSGFFHAKKLRKGLLTAGVIAAVALLTLMRLFRPERFVNMELFANLTIFISEAKTPSFILLPNRWLSESIFNVLESAFTFNTLLLIVLLFLTGYLTAVFLLLLFKKYYYRGWEIIQEGESVRKFNYAVAGAAAAPERISFSRIADRLTALFGRKSGVLTMKDLLCQFREPKNIHHGLIFLSLIIIYLFSVSALPTNWERYSAQLKYLISFFNLGLILFIIASLCSRLIYPALISEGASLWIIRTSPITPERFLWTKLIFFFVPVFLSGQMLTVSSSIIIGIDWSFIVLEAATTALFSLSLVGLAVLFAFTSMHRTKNDLHTKENRAGNAAYMLVSVALITFTLVLEIAPAFLYFSRGSEQRVFTHKAWIIIGGVTTALVFANLLITYCSLRISAKRLKNIEPV